MISLKFVEIGQQPDHGGLICFAPFVESLELLGVEDFTNREEKLVFFIERAVVRMLC
jgi:hypothetical protein